MRGTGRGEGPVEPGIGAPTFATMETGELETILAAVEDAVLVVDESDQVVVRNEAYAAAFGDAPWEPQDEAGEPLPPELHPRRRVTRGESFHLQFTLPRADGSRRWYEAVGLPLAVAGGKRRTALVIRDITERSLRHLQEQFIAVASHELRTPLSILHGYLQLARRRLGREGGPPALYLDRALEQSRRLGDLINELLDVSRLQTGRLEVDRRPMDLGALVAETVVDAGRVGNGHAIGVEVPDEPVLLEADPARLHQVVLNLLTNTFEHAPDSERVDVRLRRVEGAAELSVSDRGPGIPARELPRIFSRFHGVQRPGRRQRGLGLGLFITREIVQAHGGTIDVRSAEGEGTTFTVRLPLSSGGDGAGAGHGADAGDGADASDWADASADPGAR